MPRRPSFPCWHGPGVARTLADWCRSPFGGCRDRSLGSMAPLQKLTAWIRLQPTQPCRGPCPLEGGLAEAPASASNVASQASAVTR